MPKRGNDHQGCLLTREERYMLRVLSRDLTARLDRAHDPQDRERLERALAGLKREQQLDKQTRPRGKNR